MKTRVRRTRKQSPGEQYFIPTIKSRLSEYQASRLAGKVRSDMGDPDDARELITQFVATAYTGQGPSRALVTFVRDSLAEHLETGKSLESAFRLRNGRRGRPASIADRQRGFAGEMLRRRVVDGTAFDDAAQLTAEALGSSRSVVCAAFAKYGYEVMFALTAGDAPAIDLALTEQRDRLHNIFPGMPIGDEQAPD